MSAGPEHSLLQPLLSFLSSRSDLGGQWWGVGPQKQRTKISEYQLVTKNIYNKVLIYFKKTQIFLQLALVLLDEMHPPIIPAAAGETEVPLHSATWHRCPLRQLQCPGVFPGLNEQDAGSLYSPLITKHLLALCITQCLISLADGHIQPQPHTHNRGVPRICKNERKAVSQEPSGVLLSWMFSFFWRKLKQDPRSADVTMGHKVCPVGLPGRCSMPR